MRRRKCGRSRRRSQACGHANSDCAPAISNPYADAPDYTNTNTGSDCNPHANAQPYSESYAWSWDSYQHYCGSNAEPLV